MFQQKHGFGWPVFKFPERLGQAIVPGLQACAFEQLYHFDDCSCFEFWRIEENLDSLGFTHLIGHL